MNREVIEEEPWFYSLVSEGDSYFLEVCCGRAAVYEVRMKLTHSEKANVAADPNFVRVLAQQISDGPEKFRGRFLKD